MRAAVLTGSDAVGTLTWLLWGPPAAPSVVRAGGLGSRAWR